jgi:creatinine amidohydrolase/Fe(II)-dependent formamide hydrolase-like protein
MTNSVNEDSLDGKMSDWGPFGEHEGEWLIFSVGNPEEGHGYALPRTIDDLQAKEIAHRVMIKTGQRHAGHIPYATDHCGEIARNWAPRYVPMETFIAKVKEYVKMHLDMYADMGLPLSKVAIISSHGGNDEMIDYKDEIQQNLGLEKLLIFTSKTVEAEMNRIMQRIEELAAQNAKDGEDPDDLAFLYTQILTTSGHADHFEHSMAAAIGVLDWNKLGEMNEELAADFDATIQKYPVIGGLAGFLLKGGTYTDAMGTADQDKYGLWNSFRGLKELDGGKIVVRKEVGEMMLDLASDFIAERLQE